MHCNSNGNAEIHSLGQSWEIIIEIKHLLKVATGIYLWGHLYAIGSPDANSREVQPSHRECPFGRVTESLNLGKTLIASISLLHFVPPFLFVDSGFPVSVSLHFSVSSYLPQSFSVSLSALSLSLSHTQNGQFLSMHTSFIFHSYFLHAKEATANSGNLSDLLFLHASPSLQNRE